MSKADKGMQISAGLKIAHRFPPPHILERLTHVVNVTGLISVSSTAVVYFSVGVFLCEAVGKDGVRPVLTRSVSQVYRVPCYSAAVDSSFCIRG